MKRRPKGVDPFDWLIQNCKRDKATGCLIWQGTKASNGYGFISWNGAMRRVHRIVWAHHNGEIPVKMEIMHSRDTPPCCEITHLSMGTHQDNMDDMVRKGRHQGQQFTQETRDKLSEALRQRWAAGDPGLTKALEALQNGRDARWARHRAAQAPEHRVDPPEGVPHKP